MFRRSFLALLLVAIVAGTGVVTEAVAMETGESCGQVIKRPGGWKSLILPDYPEQPPHPLGLFHRQDETVHSATDPDDPSRMFIGNGVSVLRSENSGCTWEEVFSAATNPPEACPSPFGPSNTSACPRIYSITAAKNGRVYLQTRFGGAAIVEELPNTTVSSVDGVVVTIYRSTSRGEPGSWDALEAAPDISDKNRYQRSHVAVSPSDPNILYTTRSLNIFRSELWASTDGGDKWELRGSPGSFLRLLVDPSDPLKLWAIPIGIVNLPGPGNVPTTECPCSTGRGADLYVSSDGGASWDLIGPSILDFDEDVRGGLPEVDIFGHSGRPTKVAFARFGPTRAQVSVSDDGGRSFRPPFDIPRPEFLFDGGSAGAYAGEVEWGKGGRYLFLLWNADSLVVRYDFRRRASTIIRSSVWYNIEDRQARNLNYASESLQLLGGCGNSSYGPYDPSCFAVETYTGRGT